MKKSIKGIALAMSMLMCSSFGVSVSAADEVAINATNFPDEVFRSYVSESFDTDGSGGLSEGEISVVTYIDVSGTADKLGNIQSLKGIEFFRFLCYLDCSYNQLINLDVTNHTALMSLLCNYNKLTSLDVSKNDELRSLDIGSNQIKDIDVSKNTNLAYLGCYNNKLESLNLDNNKALINLNCCDNQIKSIDLSNNSALIELWCVNNQLTSLDLSNNKSIETLFISNNKYSIGTITSPYSLANLSEGFDASKASTWTGATYDSTTNTLTNFTSTTVTYDYDCGDNQTAKFTLVADSISEDEGNEKNYVELDTFSVDEFTVKDKTEKDPITQQDFYTGRPDNFYIKNIHENTAGALFDDYEALRLDYTITGKDKPETILAVIYGWKEPNIDWHLLAFEPNVDENGKGHVIIDLSAYEGKYYSWIETGFGVDPYADIGETFDVGFTLDSAKLLPDCDEQPTEQVEENIWSQLPSRKYVTYEDIQGKDTIYVEWNSKTKDCCDHCDTGHYDENGVDLWQDYSNCPWSTIEVYCIDKDGNRSEACYKVDEQESDFIKAKQHISIDELAEKIGKLDEGERYELTSGLNGDICYVEVTKRRFAISRELLEDYEQIAVTVRRDSADTCRHLHNQYGGSTEYCTWAGADIIDKNTDGKSMNVDLADLPSTRTIIASDDIIALSDNVENAEFEISCWWCSVESIEGTVARKPADSHTHTADNIWQKNENSHWHNCTDKDCTEKLDYAEHISSGEATVSTAESCTVCGYEIAPKLTQDEAREAFVDNLYETLLGRNAEETGLKEWTEKLESGEISCAEAVYSVVGSPEYIQKNYSYEEMVEMMYQTMLGRESDPEGKAYWVARLDAGMTIKTIVNGFAGSEEFTGICVDFGMTAGTIELNEARDQNYGLTSFVTRMYTKALERRYDEGGVNDWTGRYLTGQEDIGKIAYGFIFSPEFVNKNLSDSDYVDTLYRTFFNREPDEGGKADWMSKLAGGMSREDVLSGFVGSQECINLVASFGI